MYCLFIWSKIESIWFTSLGLILHGMIFSDCLRSQCSGRTRRLTTRDSGAKTERGCVLRGTHPDIRAHRAVETALLRESTGLPAGRAERRPGLYFSLGVSRSEAAMAVSRAGSQGPCCSLRNGALTSVSSYQRDVRPVCLGRSAGVCLYLLLPGQHKTERECFSLKSPFQHFLWGWQER